VRTTAGRCRIPDVLVVSDRPRTAVLETPPSIVVEILSPSDEMSEVIEKLEEYRSIGVRNIWVLIRAAIRPTHLMSGVWKRYGEANW